MTGYADTVVIRAFRAAGLAVVDLRTWLPRNTNPEWPNAREWSQRPPEAITIFCWHYDARPLRPTGNYDARARYAAEARDHIARDWGNGWHAPTIAYHLKIAGDGAVYVLNDVEDVTWNANDANGQDYAICLDLGEGQQPTEAQLTAAQVVAEVLSTETPRIPADQSEHYGHGELTSFGNATSCPGALLSYVQRYRATGAMRPGALGEISTGGGDDDMTQEQKDVLALLELRQITTAEQLQKVYDWTDEIYKQHEDLAAEVASLNAQLAAARAAVVPAPPPAPPTTVTNAAGSVRVELSDGRQVTIPLVKGESPLITTEGGA